MRKSQLIVSLTTVLGACAVVVACSSTANGTGPTGCSNDYSGHWKLTGSCTNTTCDLTQSACNLTVRCDDGTTGSGTVNDTAVTVNGLGPGGTGSCSVAFAGKTFSMQCSGTGSPCTDSATCESGSCGAPIASSGGTSGTSGASSTSGGTMLPCTQKAGADTDSDCVGQSGKPRKLDCDAANTSAAVAAGCTPTKAGDSDVCCPLTVSGTPSGSTSGGTDAAPPPVTCSPTAPRIFPPVAGTGPYCNGAHCAFGQLCCLNVAAGIMCAASCAAGDISLACYSNAECPTNQQCCFNATADTTSCSYLTIRGDTGSVCATSCNSKQVHGCTTSTECTGGTCTAAYFLNDTGTATTTGVGGFCH